MPEYHINDEWVLNRVKGQSSSFSQWLADLESTIRKATGEIKQAAGEMKQAHLEKAKTQREISKEQKADLTDLVAAEEQIRKAEKKFEKLAGLGSLGSFLSNLGANIADSVTRKVNESLQQSLGDLEINIDFLTGKRKNLSSALYDVAKERGIDSEGILYLIKSLPDLESFLYSTSGGKFYRDHTEHQLRVAVLGDFLLEQDLETGTLLDIISEITELDKSLLKDKYWWIAGLIHDIGYPLEKMTTAINWSLLNQILKCYPHLDLEIVPMEVILSKKGQRQEDYLAIIEEGLSKEARELIRKGAGFDLDSVPIPEAQLFKGSDAGHSEFKFKSSVKLDHGVIGAINLLRSLGTPEEIRQNRDELEGYILAAKAIALHNFKDKLPEFNFDCNPLAFLLVMVDEMQEWGRPISLQIRDSYFTTELKKVTLLDEVVLTIEEVEWIMAYRDMEAKKLIRFEFKRAIDGKEKGFFRLDRGKEFPKTRIVLQDYEVGIEGSQEIPIGGSSLGEIFSQVINENKKTAELSLTFADKKDKKSKVSTPIKKEKHISRKDGKLSKEEKRALIEKQKQALREKFAPIEKSKAKKAKEKREKLLSEYYIVI